MKSAYNKFKIVLKSKRWCGAPLTESINTVPAYQVPVREATSLEEARIADENWMYPRRAVEVLKRQIEMWPGEDEMCLQILARTYVEQY